MGKGLPLWKEHIKVQSLKLKWIGLAPECPLKKGHFSHPRFLGGPVHSFPTDFKEDLKLLLNWGVAACGETGDGESQVASALSSPRVLTCSFDLPTQGERLSALTNM